MQPVGGIPGEFPEANEFQILDVLPLVVFISEIRSANREIRLIHLKD
jgi:hypothetical protein